MTFFMPSKHYNIDKLKKKIIKQKIVQGIFPGYDMEDSHLASLISGEQGWNLFINENIDDRIAQDVLNFILKNKTAFLFEMNYRHEYEIKIEKTEVLR